MKRIALVTLISFVFIFSACSNDKKSKCERACSKLSKCMSYSGSDVSDCEEGCSQEYASASGSHKELFDDILNCINSSSSCIEAKDDCLYSNKKISTKK